MTEPREIPDPAIGRFGPDPLGVVMGQCMLCEHRLRAPVPCCVAYPGAIPEALLANEADHRQPYPHDGGVRFEPRADVPAPILASLARHFGRTIAREVPRA